MFEPLALQHQLAPATSADTLWATMNVVRDTGAPVRNRLLGALPAGELARLRPRLEMLRLDLSEVLLEPGGPIHHVYFPETAVLSLVTTLRESGPVEIATTGCEGAAGLSLFLDDQVALYRTIVQVPGRAWRMPAAEFTAVTRAPGMLHGILLRYTEAFISQVAQTAVCNAVHPVAERCACWILMTHDRVSGEEFSLTHEFLAFMLGVQRAGVTLALHALEDAGTVRYNRGRIAILDRDALERVSCECYLTVRSHYERLLPRST